jgi:hypothetical protein
VSIGGQHWLSIAVNVTLLISALVIRVIEFDLVQPFRRSGSGHSNYAKRTLTQCLQIEGPTVLSHG